MDILNPVFPATVLDQIDKCNVLGSKCSSRYSAVGDLSNSTGLEQRRNRGSSNIKSKVVDNSNGLSCSSSLNVSGSNMSVALVNDSPIVDCPIKKIAKNCKKKGKSSKKCIVNLGGEVAEQICAASENSKNNPSVSGDSTDHKVTFDGNRTCLPTHEEFHHSSSNQTYFHGTKVANCSCTSEIESSDLKHVGSLKMSLTTEHDANEVSMQASTISSSWSSGEPRVDCASNSEKCVSNMVSETCSGEKSGVDNDQVHDVLCKMHETSCISDRSLNETILMVGESKNTEKQVISDYKGILSVGCASEVNSCDNKVIMHCNNDLEILPVARKSTTGGDSGNQSSGNSGGNEAVSGRKIERSRNLSHNSNATMHMLSHAKSSSQAGKENNRFIWQKVQKNARKTWIHGDKQSTHSHMQVGIDREAALLVHHNSFSTGGLLPSPINSTFGHNCFPEEFKDMWNDDHGTYRTNSHVLVESAQRVAPFRGNAGQFLSEPRKDGIKGSKLFWEKSKSKPNQLPKDRNFNPWKKESWAKKGNLHRLRNKVTFSERKPLDTSNKTYLLRSNDSENFDFLPFSPVSAALLQRNIPYSRLPSPSDNSLLHEVGSPSWTSIPRSEHSSIASPRVSSDFDARKPTCFDIEPSCENNLKKDFTSRAGFQKWIPVGRKDSWMLKTNAVINEPILSGWKSETGEETTSINHRNSCSHSKTVQFSSCDMTTCQKIDSNSLEFDKLGNESSCRGQSEKFDVLSNNVSIGISLLDIGSLKAEKALYEAYRLQRASERVHMATGSPLAEFERLLHSASPVIINASVSKQCKECSVKQGSLNSLCKHEIPNIPLSSIWNWYEKPASYGLEVQAEDSECLNGVHTHGMSFYAHFVPFLSAVQLFVPSRGSKCSRNGDTASEVLEEGNQAAEQFSSSISTELPCTVVVKGNPSEVKNFVILADVSSKPIDVVPCDGQHSSCDDICLAFEFFESEQPQQRKPLYDKMMELAEDGAYCSQAYGDPSKLKCLNLQDLHPGSWYSVAWYPIYRIPEGNLRASFLTYHSLGHLAQRCILTPDSLKEVCIVCPVLGLQSYNTQGECWFHPKMHSHFSSLETMPSSDILRERLRTLEEVALLFARGAVYKANTRVANRQPDYEFFLSRKY